MGTAQHRAALNTNFYERGDKIPGLKIEAQNILMVRETIKWAGEYVKKNGPLFLEAFTYRYHGHSMSDPGITYRTKDEIADVRKTRDPVEICRNMILEHGWAEAAELKKIEKDIRSRLEGEAEKIRSDPVPTEADLYTHIGVTKQHYIRGVEYRLSKDYE